MQTNQAPSAFVEHLANCPQCQLESITPVVCDIATLLWNDIVKAAHTEPQVLIFDLNVMAQMANAAREANEQAFPA